EDDRREAIETSKEVDRSGTAIWDSKANEAGWVEQGPSMDVSSDVDVWDMQAAHNSDRPIAAHPMLKSERQCGDANGDGVLDSMGLVDAPRAVCILSGPDRSILRTLMADAAAPFTSAATNSFEVDDVNGDGVQDWIICLRVSESQQLNEGPRNCRLGLISLVSGADRHVIRTIERDS